MALITMKSSSSMTPLTAKVRMNGAVSHSTYMPSLCGQGNFSSTIVININGDECPVDPDNINGWGEYKTLCYLKIYIFNYP